MRVSELSDIKIDGIYKIRFVRNREPELYGYLLVQVKNIVEFCNNGEEGYIAYFPLVYDKLFSPIGTLFGSEHFETVTINRVIGDWATYYMDEVPRGELPLYIGYPCTHFFDLLLRGSSSNSPIFR